MLALMLACAVGEAPPQSPAGGPAAEEEAEPEGAPGAAAGADAEAESRAAELLTRSRLAYEGGDVEESLRLARRVLDEYAATGSSGSARWVAARSAFAMGRYEAARSLAREYAAAQPAGSSAEEEARRLVELAEDALRAPADAVVGAVLPRTGPRVLVRYGDWILEGLELAVAAAEREQNRRIELVIADDAGGARVEEAVRELERRGVVAVVGPLLGDQLPFAARARRDDRLVLVSPTSPDVPQSSEVYTINSNDARGAQALGRYAAEVGLRQAAVLYPRIAEYERKAQAFSVEFEDLGGEVRAMVPYDSGTTTFAEHMRRILAAVEASAGAGGLPYEPGVSSVDSLGQPVQQPFALFVAAPGRDVRQIAPQVGFYGLDSAGVQLFGDEAWASATVRRVVPARDLENTIAASRFPPDRADAAADPAFVEAYETRYRRSLENELPALGYDAANLVVQALPNRMLTPDAFARRFRLLAGIRGATGLLSVRANRVVRTPYLVVIRGGELEPAPYPWEYSMPEPKPPVSASRAGGGR